MCINQFNPLLKSVYSDLSMLAKNSACKDYTGLNVYIRGMHRFNEIDFK